MVTSTVVFALVLVVLSLLHHGNSQPQTKMCTSQRRTFFLPQKKLCSPIKDVDPLKSRAHYVVQHPVGIDYEELLPGVMEGSLLLIDVRNPSELKESGKLKGSYNLPLPEVDLIFKMSPADFESRYGFPRPKPKDTNVVLTCKAGVRALEAWEKLEPLGYCNIRVYFGSYLDWTARGGPLVFP